MDKLMWIALFFHFMPRGDRVPGLHGGATSDCAIDQHPFSGRSDYILWKLRLQGCNDIGHNETVLGFTASCLMDRSAP